MTANFGIDCTGFGCTMEMAAARAASALHMNMFDPGTEALERCLEAISLMEELLEEE